MLFGIALLVGLQQSERKRKAAKMKAQINQLRLQSLQSQLNPHFIFNIQAAIQGIWLEGKEKNYLFCIVEDNGIGRKKRIVYRVILEILPA